jgi:hypothetical protein
MATKTPEFQNTMRKLKGGKIFDISPWDGPGPNCSYQKFSLNAPYRILKVWLDISTRAKAMIKS